MNNERIDVTRISAGETMAVAGRLRGRFQLLGGTGSGFTRVTDVHTDRVLLAPACLEEWSAPALLVMRELLSPAEAVALERWDVGAAFDTVRRLVVGEAILLERRPAGRLALVARGSWGSACSG
ncbi:hypothetical protein [Nocardioides aurantiacus]|uniref:hypothetical protein n=1 Tax=Nocardioides aurantiacus TaxID=86796 RepID=UPI000F471DAC|nr:hypothetical protein [Nocardioides aurantiacus]